MVVEFITNPLSKNYFSSTPLPWPMVIYIVIILSKTHRSVVSLVVTVAVRRCGRGFDSHMQISAPWCALSNRNYTSSNKVRFAYRFYHDQCPLYSAWYAVRFSFKRGMAPQSSVGSRCTEVYSGYPFFFFFFFFFSKVGLVKSDMCRAALPIPDHLNYHNSRLRYPWSSLQSFLHRCTETLGTELYGTETLGTELYCPC